MGQLVSKQTNGSELSKNDIMTIIKSTIPARAVLESFVNSEDIMYGDWVDGYRPITSKRVINGITYYLLKYDQYVRVVRGSDNAAAYYVGEIANFDPTKWNDITVFTNATGRYRMAQRNLADDYMQFPSSDQIASDIGNFQGKSFNYCKAECDKRDDCKAFNFTQTSYPSGNGDCYLKNNTNNAVINNVFHLFVKNPTPPVYSECVQAGRAKCVVKGLS